MKKLTIVLLLGIFCCYAAAGVTNLGNITVSSDMVNYYGELSTECVNSHMTSKRSIISLLSMAMSRMQSRAASVTGSGYVRVVVSGSEEITLTSNLAATYESMGYNSATSSIVDATILFMACQPLDQCHEAGVYDPATKSCTNPLKSDGSVCDQWDMCTASTCQSGVCTAGRGITCTAIDQCHSAGTCDPATGTCSSPPLVDGTACNDGDACSQSDTCQSGICYGSNNITCTALDECHTVGTCNLLTGVCSNPLAVDGASCSDGNACTQTDTCQSGVCTGGNNVTCTASDQCHIVGTCNPATGSCSSPAAVDGSSCSDGDACTQTDSCQSGLCVGGNNVTCTASDQCHAVGMCDSATGLCSNPVVADGNSCNDENACTQTDTCQSGVCTGGNNITCTASDQCHTVGACDSATGVCSNPPAADGNSCNDDDACTQTDTCQSGVCNGGNNVICTAQDQCHSVGTCDSATGTCSNPAASDGVACSDEDSCTQTDTCQSGVCIGGNNVTCTASDQCHTVGTCNSATGTCSNPSVADGVACNDSNACSQTDTCQSGVCTGNNMITCSALDQCHVAGTCDAATGLCSNPSASDGVNCNDGDACTQTDSCQSGVCVGGNNVTCTASNQCHVVGTCNSTTGSCSNPAAADGSSCSDGNACTQTDTCQSGVCTGGNSKVCTALDQCHVAGTCDAATGACSNPAIADNTACNDGNACSRTDTCQSGVCTGGNSVTCTASDQCHIVGTCNPATGTCSNPAAVDGASCDDGNACTQTDECQSGVCTGGNNVNCSGFGFGCSSACNAVTGTCSLPSQCTSYTNNSDTSRLTTAGSGSICDSSLWTSTVWVRFTIGQGYIPFTATSPSICSTAATGWVNIAAMPACGTTIPIQMCYSWTSSTCQWSDNILLVMLIYCLFDQR